VILPALALFVLGFKCRGYSENSRAHTSGIESLPSLILRLSWQHAISPVVLTDYLRSPLARAPSKEVSAEIRRTRGYEIARIIVGTPCFEILDGLRQAYGHSDFRSCTLTALDEIDSNLVGQVRPRMAWCPHCLQSDFEQDRPPYFRLLWTLTGYPVCHEHECEIEELCPKCNSKQTAWQYRELGCCWKCGHFLGFSEKPRALADLSRRAEIERQQLIELIGEIAHNPEFLVKESKCRLVVDGFVAQMKKQFPMRTTRETMFGKASTIVRAIERNISLTNCLHFASAFGYSLVELLDARVSPVQDELSVLWKVNRLYDYEPRARPGRRPFETIRDIMLSQHTDKSSPPYPLEFYVGLTGVSRGCLEARYPSLCRQIVNAHKVYRDKIKRENRLSIYKELYEYMSKNGSLPGKKQMLFHLQCKFRLPKNFTREILAERRASRLFFGSDEEDSIS